MATYPTAAGAAAKRVRFNPFVTYLGDEPDPPPEMEDSLRMDSSHNMMMPGKRSSGGGNKRRSMDLNEAFDGTAQHFGNMSLGGGEGSIGFGFGGFGSSGSSDLLNLSSESVLEVDGEDDDEEEDLDRSFSNPLSMYDDKFGSSLNFSFGNQSDSSLPCHHNSSIRSEPTSVAANNRPTADAKLAVGTVA